MVKYFPSTKTIFFLIEEVCGAGPEGTGKKMEPLPSELFVEILSFLPGKDVFKSCLVCTKWNHIIRNSIVLWQSLISRDFVAMEKGDGDDSWMDTYKNCAR